MSTNNGVTVRIIPTHPTTVPLKGPMAHAIYEAPQNGNPILALRKFMNENDVAYGDIFTAECTGDKRTCDYVIFIFVLDAPKREASKIAKKALTKAFKKAMGLGASTIEVKSTKTPGVNWRSLINNVLRTCI